ncbi:MAG TPA: DUF2917 domain-containing protein [Ramlibacter sp.]|nr:DUF2917 domain-containing protein [Ramlibacter sp.]
MTHPTHSRDLRLERRGLHSFPDAAGLTFDCKEGSVWVTVDGDEHDYILEAGESFSTQEHGRVVVYAFEPARVAIAPPAPSRLSYEPMRLASLTR